MHTLLMTKYLLLFYLLSLSLSLYRSVSLCTYVLFSHHSSILILLFYGSIIVCFICVAWKERYGGNLYAIDSQNTELNVITVKDSIVRHEDTRTIISVYEGKKTKRQAQDRIHRSLDKKWQGNNLPRNIYSLKESEYVSCRVLTLPAAKCTVFTLSFSVQIYTCVCTKL